MSDEDYLATDGTNMIVEGPEENEHCDFVLKDVAGQEYRITCPEEAASIASLLGKVAHEDFDER